MCRDRRAMVERIFIYALESGEHKRKRMIERERKRERNLKRKREEKKKHPTLYARSGRIRRKGRKRRCGERKRGFGLYHSRPPPPATPVSSSSSRRRNLFGNRGSKPHEKRESSSRFANVAAVVANSRSNFPVFRFVTLPRGEVRLVTRRVSTAVVTCAKISIGVLARRTNLKKKETM